MNKNEKMKAVADLEKVLHDRGIELEVLGCGCCGSPIVRARIDGEFLIGDPSKGEDFVEITSFKKEL